ncbi:helix-turn-helix domain-containing protein [Nonomuraea sp. NPDC049152]|uniref:PucR family transcriptional regulator n=1 Tax=Nonomuraea sp. NPDC049152 TaxID=3154350 RepID=UPI0033BFCC45
MTPGSGPQGSGARGWEAPVTVAELVNGGPLAGARMYGAGEHPVHHVRIVDDLSVFSAVAPHTAVVLIGQAAGGGWAVEMAMRRAWEQAAACVIAPAEGAGAGSAMGSSAVLAERLGITLIFVDADPLVTAVEVASAAARPSAARTQLVARCATRLAEAGASARRVLGVLNAELPGTSVAFVDQYGTRLAGRAAALSPGASGPWPVEVAVRAPDGTVLGRLLAGGPARSAGWPAVVRTVLGLAVAPLVAWAAAERLAASGDFALQSALADRLLLEAATGKGAAGPDGRGVAERGQEAETGGVDDPADEGVWARAVALGWAVRGPVAAFTVRPQGRTPEPGDAERVRAVIVATVGQAPVISRGDGWAGWSPLPPERLGERLEATLRALPWPCAAGVGAPVAHLGAMGESLLGAEAAAFLAAVGDVARSDRMGPAELLAAIPGSALRAPATVVLQPLLAVDRDGTLLETLGAVLGEGGAVKAAERLGVHRNTVTARLDRIRDAGYDLDDRATRLALQLACHVIRAG